MRATSPQAIYVNYCNVLQFHLQVLIGNKYLAY